MVDADSPVSVGVLRPCVNIERKMNSSNTSPIASTAASHGGELSVSFGFVNTYARLPEYF